MGEHLYQGELDWSSDEGEPVPESAKDTDDIDIDEDCTDSEEPWCNPGAVMWSERAAGSTPKVIKEPYVVLFKKPSRSRYAQKTKHPCCKMCEGTGNFWVSDVYNCCHDPTCWRCGGTNLIDIPSTEPCWACNYDGIARKYTAVDDEFDQAVDLCDPKSAQNNW